MEQPIAQASDGRPVKRLRQRFRAPRLEAVPPREGRAALTAQRGSHHGVDTPTEEAGPASTAAWAALTVPQGAAKR